MEPHHLGHRLCIFSDIVLAYALMPGFGLAALGAKLFEKSHRAASLFVIITAWLYNVLIMTLSTNLVYSLVLNNSHGSLFPTLLWAFTLATAPWLYAASVEIMNEERNRGHITGDYSATVTTVVLQAIGLAISSTLVLIHVYLSSFLLPFYISMVALLIIQVAYVFNVIIKAERAEAE